MAGAGSQHQQTEDRIHRRRSTEQRQSPTTRQQS